MTVKDPFLPFETPTFSAIPGFMQQLEQVRALAAPNDWRKIVKSSSTVRRWRWFLSHDPYTRWGLIKPRGYPGDATLMDFAYGHPSIQDELDCCSPQGLEIYRHTASAPQSESARKRVRVMAARIESLAWSVPNVRVISIASGHARELEGLDNSLASRLASFVAVDQDELSLEQARLSAGNIPFESVRVNVITDDLSPIAPAHLVYSLGLFDYLKTEHAVSVLNKMCRLAVPGGTVVVANLAPDAANLGYCEAIMDWWMIPRTEEEMRQLGESLVAPDGRRGEIAIERHGCFHYLVLTKLIG